MKKAMKVEKKYPNRGWVDIFREISRSTAKKEISSFIIENKKKGITRLSVLDFVLNLKLPARQVENILEGFENKGQLKEINA